MFFFLKPILNLVFWQSFIKKWWFLAFGHWFKIAETLKIAKITYVTKIEIFSKIFFEKKFFSDKNVLKCVFNIRKKKKIFGHTWPYLWGSIGIFALKSKNSFFRCHNADYFSQLFFSVNQYFKLLKKKNLPQKVA